MKTEFLKGLGLTDDQVKSIMAENGKDVEAEKEKAKAITTELDGVKVQLTEANKTITDLKKDNKGNEELQKKVTEYEGTIETLKKDSERKTFDMALELELTKANAKKTKAVKSLLDLDKVKQKEDGTFEGLNEQLEELKKSDDYLFNTGTVKTDYNPAGGLGTNVGDLATLMRSKDFNLTEYLEKENKK